MNEFLLLFPLIVLYVYALFPRENGEFVMAARVLSLLVAVSITVVLGLVLTLK